jgi:hypothetical protein
MEVEELDKMWQQYDLKLDNLERLNKRLILDTLSKKPKRNLNWLQVKIIYAIIVTPLVFVFFFKEFIIISDLDWQMIVGGLLSIAVLFTLMYFYIKGFLALVGIKVNENNILTSYQKVCKYKSIVNRRQKYLWVSYPILIVGFVLVGHRILTFDTKGLFFMIGILVFVFVIGYARFKYQQNEIKVLEDDLKELKDYLQL